MDDRATVGQALEGDPAAMRALVRLLLPVVQARVVLIATGVRWRKLDAKGASNFERAGVYYACTAIEALLHDNEDVFVVGGGNSAGQAAMYLAECCTTRTVHVVAPPAANAG